MKKIYTSLSLFTIVLFAAVPVKVYAQCNTPANLDSTELTFSTLGVSWDAADSASSYEIVINNSSSTPQMGSNSNNTSLTTFLAQGLAIDKLYCVHVRSLCDSSQTSSWATACYTTPCTGYTTNTLSADSIKSSSVRLNWDAFSWASSYQYSVVAGDTAPPTIGANTISNTLMLQGLMPDKEYCVYLRAYCPNSGTFTEWEKVCFITKPVSVEVDIIAPDITFMMFPNPVQDVLKIIAPLISETHQVAIMDMTGRRIHQSTFETKYTEIALNKINPGVYIVKVAGKNYNYTYKIVKL